MTVSAGCVYDRIGNVASNESNSAAGEGNRHLGNSLQRADGAYNVPSAVGLGFAGFSLALGQLVFGSRSHGLANRPEKFVGPGRPG